MILMRVRTSRSGVDLHPLHRQPGRGSRATYCRAAGDRWSALVDVDPYSRSCSRGDLRTGALTAGLTLSSMEDLTGYSMEVYFYGSNNCDGSNDVVERRTRGFGTVPTGRTCLTCCPRPTIGYSRGWVKRPGGPLDAALLAADLLGPQRHDDRQRPGVAAAVRRCPSTVAPLIPCDIGNETFCKGEQRHERGHERGSG